MADTLDEYGQSEAMLPSSVPQPFWKANGRPAVPMIKLIELAGKDTRMGRKEVG